MSRLTTRRNWIMLIVLLVVLAVGAGMVFLRADDEDETPKTQQSTPVAGDGLPYGPIPTYPKVTDLAPDAVDLDNGRTFPSLTYGIQTFFWWNETYRKFGLTQINIMQFTHIRQDFAWIDIEPERRAEDHPTRYIWAQADLMMQDIEEKGVSVIARLDKPPEWAINRDVAYEEAPYDLERLADYCGAVAERYQGRIDAYQIWNEPNLTRDWANLPPSPAGYVQLLEACASAIHEADPDALIISAGLAPTGTRNADAMPDEEFFWRMYEAGASPHFDVLGVHAPGYALEPEVDPATIVEQGYLEWQCFRHVEHIRAIMVANGDAHKQIAITETGWTTDPRPDSIYNWFAVSEETQGDYLARAYQYAAQHWRPWVGVMVTLYYPNPAWTEEDEEYWWAIGTVAPMPYGMDGRPAWAALVQMEKISSNPAYSHPARDEYGNPVD